MTASQPGYYNLQSLTGLGALAVGYRIYTYTYGTTTQKTAYTDAAAAVPHTYTSDGVGGQYIATNARGEIPAPLFLSSGAYDIVLKDSAGATIWTRRADPISDVSVVTVTADTPRVQAALTTASGSNGLQLLDQTLARKGQVIYWGSTSTPSDGATANSVSINTTSGVPLYLGTNDTVRMTFSAATGDITALGMAISRSKAATTSRNTTTTLADDPHLVAPLSIGTWAVEVFVGIAAAAGGGANGFKVKLNFSGTVTNDAVTFTSDSTLALNYVQPISSTETVASISTSTSPITSILIKGTVTVTVAGNLALQWAQNSSGVQNLHFFAGAYLTCTKVA